tara:strand:+ start:15708 stop:16787 length:1080 start_codon:yes stop_codon:yes gene_type:complete
MNNKIVYDKSVYGATRAGVYVFARGVLQALKKEGSIDIIEFDNPFSTVGKSGLARKISSLLRLLYSEFIVFFYRRKHLFFFPAPEMPILVALLKLDYVITIHDLFTWKNTKKTTFFASAKQRLLPFYAKRAKYVLTVSEYSKAEIVDFFGICEDSIIICSNGLPEFFTEDDFLDEDYTINDDFPYILFVGSSEPRKNLIYLVDVFDALNRQRSISGQKLVKLIMTCGETWTNNNLQQRIDLSPYRDFITITGQISESHKAELYRGAFATILPSLAEGFGIPVIESLAYGTPVFVHNNTALSIFSHYGAIVMDDYDSDLWAAKISDVIDCRKRVPQFYVEKVINTFTWQNSIKTIVEKVK